MIKRPPQPYFVPNVYLIPLQYASDLILNQNVPKQDAIRITINRYAYYGRDKQKRLKDFNPSQFERHLKRFLDIPNGYLARRSSKTL